MSEDQTTATRRALRIAAGEMALRYGDACRLQALPDLSEEWPIRWSRARYRRFLALQRLLRALEVAS